MPQRGGYAVPILALTLGHVFANAVRSIPALAADVLQRDLLLSPEGLGLMAAVYPLAFAFGMVPVGVGLDRFGVRRTSLSLFAVAGGGAVLAALAPGAGSMVLAQALLGFGCSGMLMCPMTFAARNVPPSRFMIWSGIILTFGNSGLLLSASPLAVLVDWAGWRASFWVSAGLAALAFLAVAATVPGGRPARAAGSSVLGDARAVLALAASRPLRPMMAIAFASFAVMYGIRGLWGGPWLMETKGLDRLAAGNILLGFALAMTLAPVICGAIGRAAGRPVLLLAGSHFTVALMLVALVAGGPEGAALPPAYDAAMFFVIGCVISFQILCFDEVRRLVPAELAGRALSAQNMSFFGGAAVLQVVAGLAAAWGGPGAALLSFALALVICTGLFLLWRRAG
ncbi:MFS transporter [Siccirubricoccus sp. KC 17139]|uniref:MFS transporter n=1 Tax=Siccirubricoccus soli TaxID=2899147 RepID=A0ABT1D6U9_9PROT|nr:MFS transporter [Siccirubricoccus soli]MCO6417631.1 MFS transporter [Siccirubricoccus soli]MCP2683766.1 MFS transporter [Siccirubricoccus soli]